MATSSSCHIIATVWLMVEVFLDLDETISMAKTCRSLHNTIVDANTQKLKVSHLKLGISPLRYGTLQLALTCIHFPSLRKLKIRFPERINLQYESVWVSLFSICAANLVHAHNLEMLRLNISENISVVNVKTMSWWIGLFGKNLAKCSKLRELTISAYKSTKIEHFSYISDVINALIPTISMRKDTIEKFSLYTNFSCGHYMVNFFAAVLHLKNLKSLRIDSRESDNLYDALLNAAARVCPYNAKPMGMKRLVLESNWEHHMQLNITHSFAPLLEYYSDCISIEHIFLGFPAKCWKDRYSLLAWRKLVMNKPKLTYLSCDFDAYGDYDGKVMKVFSDFVRDHQNRNEIRHIIIQYLENVDSNSFAEMRQSLDDAGVILKYGDPRCVENEPERMEIDEVYFAVRN